MKIKIASTLEGRDLAVIKSVLNIKNEYEKCLFKYIDDQSHGDFIISKECKADHINYFAVSNINSIKTPILPTLNPKSLRDLFSSLASILKNGNQRLDSLIQLKTTDNQLLDYVRSKSTDLMILAVGSVTVMLDRANDVCYASLSEQELFANCSDLTQYKVTQFCSQSEVDNMSVKQIGKMSVFCWHMGLQIDTNIVGETRAHIQKFKLTTWPNFGKFNYEDEFISLSSLIWTRAKSISELVECTGFDELLIRKYLNAILLTSHAVTLSQDKPSDPVRSTQKPTFLSGLKIALGI